MTVPLRAALYLRASTARQAEQRGAKVKKKLEIDPLHADTVRLIYRLALEGDGTSGPLAPPADMAPGKGHAAFAGKRSRSSIS